MLAHPHATHCLASSRAAVSALSCRTCSPPSPWCTSSISARTTTSGVRNVPFCRAAAKQQNPPLIPIAPRRHILFHRRSKKNKYLPKIHAWIQARGGGEMVPFSVEFERQLWDLRPGHGPEGAREKLLEESGAKSALPKIITVGYSQARWGAGASGRQRWGVGGEGSSACVCVCVYGGGRGARFRACC